MNLSARRALRRTAIRKRASVARTYSKKHRRRRGGFRLRSALPRAAAAGLLLGIAVLVADQAVGAGGVTVAALQRSIEQVLAPPAIEERQIVVGATLSTAPILDSFDQVTREQRFVVSGHLPTLALEGERPRVEVIVNNSLAASPATDDRGRFSATVVLVSGPNVIRVAAVRPGERAESAPRGVTLDTVPPPLTVRAPSEGATIDGSSVRVEGATEPGAKVAINGNAVNVGFDGAFSSVVPISGAGELSIEVSAVDAAGNETKRTVKVTAKPSAAPATALTVRVSIDKSKVKAGEPVLADVSVTDAAGFAVRDATVSVSAGLLGFGAGRTDSSGRYRAAFNAPELDGFVQVVAIVTTTTGTGRGAVSLEVMTGPTPKP